MTTRRIFAAFAFLGFGAVASLSAQPAYRSANGVLPGSLGVLQAERALFAGDAAGLGAALSTEGFEAASPGNPLNFGGFTVSLLSGSFSVQDGNALITTEGSRVITFSTPSTVRFTFASAINAFGLDITSIDFDATGISYLDNLGNTTGIGVAPQFASATFFGVTNSQAFSWVDLSFVGSETIGLDFVQWGSAQTTVPEPSSFALLLLGLVPVAVARRRANARRS